MNLLMILSAIKPVGVDTTYDALVRGKPKTIRHPKPVIGLLGAPGSGKSTVARVFADLGCRIIDADQLAHEALQTEPVKATLRAWWGDRVLNSQGDVDRKEVGKIVFNEVHELHRLEQLIHPLVHQARQAERQRLFKTPECKAIIEDCPLLLETGLNHECDALVYVDCPEETRFERLSATRGWDRAEMQRREQKQLPLDMKRQSADYVISNGEAEDQLREQAEYVLHQIGV